MTSPLKEKDFIQERKNGYGPPLWLWIFIITAVASMLWLGIFWLTRQMTEQISVNPLLKVTNRQFSLFLWQFPEYMRPHRPDKTGYLPGFYSQKKVTVKPEAADQYVAAPPDVIFFYHVWDRQIRQEFISRSIPVDEFTEFIIYIEEWLPKNWPDAPTSYITLIQSFPETGTENLQTLSELILPQQVRRAFQGWKNYFKEGEAINQVKPTFGGMREFLQGYPHYARNYWRNLYPDYLKTLLMGDFIPGETVPSNEIPSFLRVAYFNFQQAKEGL